MGNGVSTEPGLASPAGDLSFGPASRRDRDVILVTGATGNIGGEVTRALAGAGRPVRALTRDPSSASLPAGADAATGDLTAPGTLTSALRGVTAVFLLAGYPDAPGPQALLPADRLAILGGVLGRDLRLEALPDDDARREMSTSMPGPLVDAFFEFSRGGTYRDDQVTGTTAKLLGRPARAFSDWAQAHADAFAS